MVDLKRFDTLDWVDRLAREYTGADFAHGADGERHYQVTIRVDAWTGQH